MRYTDIVKARALKRAGRACEMCGMPVGFETAQFVSAHPIFGILFDQDDCCVLCHDCLAELGPDTRAAAESGPRGGFGGHEARADTDPPERGPLDTRSREGEARDSDAAVEPPEIHGEPAPTRLPRGVREERLPRRDPDGGMCA